MSHLFAQLPNPDAAALGAWLLCLASVLVAVDRARAVFSWLKGEDKSKPAEERVIDAVSRNEFTLSQAKIDQKATKEEINVLRADINACASRVELQRLEAELKELQKCTFERYGKLVNDINAVQVRMESMHREIASEISTEADRVLHKVDEMGSNHIVALQTLLEKLVHNETKKG